MIYAFFPLVAAALYGLSYILIERITHQVNMTTYYVVSLCIWLAFSLGHSYLKNESVTLGVLKDNPPLVLLIVLASVSGSVAWILTTYTMKNISANYAAFGEISYPLFTLLFAYLLFGTRNFEITTVIGGMLIMIGSFILVYGKARS